MGVDGPVNLNSALHRRRTKAWPRLPIARTTASMRWCSNNVPLWRASSSFSRPWNGSEAKKSAAALMGVPSAKGSGVDPCSVKLAA